MATKLQKILAALDKEVIDRKYKLPFKDAELKYKVRFRVPQNIQEFYYNCGDYWNYLNKIDTGTTANVPLKLAIGYGLKIVSQKYSKEGSIYHAFKLSQTYTFGAILQCITDEFVTKRINSYFDYVLRTFVNPYDYNEIKSIILEYVQRFKIPYTQFELQSWIGNYSQFLRSHLRWMNELKLDRESRLIGF